MSAMFSLKNRVNAVSSQIAARSLLVCLSRNWRFFPKIDMKSQKTPTSQNNIKEWSWRSHTSRENLVQRYNIKTMWCVCADRRRGELTTQNRAESPEPCPDTHSQMHLAMVPRPPGEETVAFFLKKWCWKNWISTCKIVKSSHLNSSCASDKTPWQTQPKEERVHSHSPNWGSSCPFSICTIQDPNQGMMPPTVGGASHTT